MKNNTTLKVTLNNAFSQFVLFCILWRKIIQIDHKDKNVCLTTDKQNKNITFLHMNLHTLIYELIYLHTTYHNLLSTIWYFSGISLKRFKYYSNYIMDY